ncbi:MAG: glycine cleavage system protein GcvH [Ilumatobacteraceae bacterium]|jgi:glycine cleavage system H protein
MMNVPDSLRYSENHEWAQLMDRSVRVGITDIAQDALGEVVHVRLPEVGSRVVASGLMGEVESTKSVSEIYSPVAGTVTRVNERLRETPGLINTDPYGDGWVCEVSELKPDALDALLDSSAYRRLIGE